MKKIIFAVLAVTLTPVLCLAAEKKIELKTDKDKLSYAIGTSIGQDFSRQKLDVDPDIVTKGLKDTMVGNPPLLTEEEIEAVMIAFQKKLMAEREAELKAEGEKNASEGAAFLTENGKKEGIVTLPSGLQYKIITKGKGKLPKKGDTVTVNYTGRLIDGSEFDSSYKRGEPAVFTVDGVIPGWSEALMLMEEGSKWEVFIPAALAYGERGAGRVIGPNSTLIFEMELLSIAQP
jgi:FKBP-type peptidyl-prolyl cis-trans isomerase FklB